MNAAAKRHRPTCMAPTRPFRRLVKGCIGTPAPTVRSMVPTSTRYPTYPAAEKPDHTRQHRPCHSTEVRHQHTKMCLPPAPPRRKRRQWARSSRQHALRPDVPDTPPRRKRLPTNQRAQTVVHYTPKIPCHPHVTEVNCTLSKHSGGFATIDTRHADDTPQTSAYGSNSPQATNEHKPHHHDKHTKTSRTRPTQPPKEHAALALPSNHAGDFATIDPSTGTRRWPFRPSTRGVLRP